MRTPLVPLLLLHAALAGCGGVTQDDPAHSAPDGLDRVLVEDSADAAAATRESSGLARPLLVDLDTRTLGTDAAGDAAGQVQSASARVLGSYAPSGCATLSLDPQTPGHVRIVFTGCSTAAGLTGLSGVLDAVFSGEPGRVHVELGAPAGLIADGTTIAYAASADVVTSDAQQTITWKTSAWRTAGARGTVAWHRADHTIALDRATHCVVTSGRAATEIAPLDPRSGGETRALETVIDDFAYCPGACPTSGTIRSTGVRTRRTVVLRFDGANVAHVTDAHGSTFDLPLHCGG